MAKTTSQSILLIDDDIDNMAFLIIALEDYGFNILTATGGQEGLACARRDTPDLILLDVHMPGMDGFAVCEALKAAPRTAAIPVIFLTAFNVIDSKIRGFSAGAVDYLVKPVVLAELYARVTAHLNQQRIYDNLRRRLDMYQQRFGSLENEAVITDTSQKHLRQVYQVRNILLQNLHSPPSLPQLAAEVGSNPHKLSKDFQILFGMTVFDWLRDYRLQQAARLLRATDKSAAYIANEVGYASSSNLSTAFKARFGVSPREYRKSKY